MMDCSTKFVSCEVNEYLMKNDLLDQVSRYIILLYIHVKISINCVVHSCQNIKGATA